MKTRKSRVKQLSFFKKKRLRPGKKYGRPPTTFVGGRQARDAFSKHHPLHITLRLREGLPNLRTRRGAQMVKNAILGAQAAGLRVVHFSILSNHVHMVVEASRATVLFNSMKSFCTRLAIGLRRAGDVRTIAKLDRKGWGIFRGRYHMKILKSPSQVKEALQYVLLNPAKHFQKAPYVDVFSSAALFKNWKKLIGHDINSPTWTLAMQERLKEFILLPKLWLLVEGWGRA